MSRSTLLARVAALFFFAAATSHSAPPAGLFAGANLVPDTTVFYTEFPSVTELNTKFFSAHNAVGSQPLVAAARAANATSPVLNIKPVLAMPPLADDFFGALYLMTPNNFFVAMTPAPQGLRFIIGGRVAQPEPALQGLKAAVDKKAPGLKWESSSTNGMTLLKTTLPGVGDLQFAAGNGWLLTATDPAALAHAMSIAASGKADAHSLSATSPWKSSVAVQTSTPLFIYYSWFDGVANVSEVAGAPSAAQLFRGRLSGAQAVSWTWNTGLADKKAYDRFAVTLAPEVAAAAAKATVPWGANPVPLVGPDTVCYFAVRAKFSTLFETPAFAGLPLAGQGKQWLEQLKLSERSKEPPASVVLLTDHVGTEPRTAWIVQLPKFADVVGFAKAMENRTPKPARPVLPVVGSSATYLVIADDMPSAEYFISRLKRNEKGSGSKEVKSTNLPVLDGSFALLRLDRKRIIADLIANLKKNPAASIAALKKRGLNVSEADANLDLGAHLGPMQLSAAMKGNHLLIDNYFTLPDSASTKITATTILATQVYGPQIETLIKRGEAFFQPGGTPGVEANPFDIWVVSNFPLGPILCNASSYPPGLDIVAHFLLAAPPSPESL